MKFKSTRKYIILFIAACFLIGQINYPNNAFAKTTGLDSQSKEDIEKDLEKLLEKIKSFTSWQDEIQDGTALSEKRIELRVGEEKQLKLLRDTGEIIEDVDWLCITRTPYDKIYLAGFSDMSQENRINLLADGTIQAKEVGEVQVWARKEQYLYRCDVEVISEKKAREYEKAEEVNLKIKEVTKDLHHLSDMDKVLFIHDYLIDHIDYSLKYKVRDQEYGAIIIGDAACWGYAKAFRKYMLELDVETEVLLGDFFDSYHAWNLIKIDDKWYYMDITGDDTSDLKYRYFMLDKDTLSKTHSVGYITGNRQMGGQEYRLYPYKKKGIVAKDEEELKKILTYQYHHTVTSPLGAKDKLFVHNSIEENRIREILSDLLNTDEENIYLKVLDEIDTYKQYFWSVGRITIPSARSNRLLSVEEVNPSNETSNLLEIKFEDDIDLIMENIQLIGADKLDLKKKDNKTYLLEIGNIFVGQGKEITINIRKQGVFFQGSNQKKVKVNFVKETTPKVKFTAIDVDRVRLENLEPGMKYKVAGSEWQEVNSSEAIEIIVPYKRPISVIKMGKNKKTDSEPQKKVMTYVNQPDWIKAVDCEEGKNNGQLVGVNYLMEYREIGQEIWNACHAPAVTGLKAGQYEVRFKPYASNMASHSQEIEIKSSLPKEEIQKPDESTSQGQTQVEEDRKEEEIQKPDESTSQGQTQIEDDKGKEEIANNNSFTNSAIGPNNGENSSIAIPKQKNKDKPRKKDVKPISPQAFKDIDNHWARSSIKFALDKGIFKGVAPGVFSPDGKLTRGMFVTILARMSKDDIYKYKANSFKDVEKEAYYSKSVEWAKTNKLVKGTGFEKFEPEKEISREEIAVILLAYAKYKNIALIDVEESLVFEDIDEIEAYAREAVGKMQKSGLMKGRSDGKFYPKDNATRAEICIVIERIYDLKSKEKDISTN